MLVVLVVCYQRVRVVRSIFNILQLLTCGNNSSVVVRGCVSVVSSVVVKECIVSSIGRIY